MLLKGVHVMCVHQCLCVRVYLRFYKYVCGAIFCAYFSSPPDQLWLIGSLLINLSPLLLAVSAWQEQGFRLGEGEV